MYLTGLDRAAVGALRPLQTQRPVRGSLQRLAARRVARPAAPGAPHVPSLPPPTPSPSLATDPAYLAFMRQLNATEADTAASTRSSQDALHRALARQTPLVQLLGEQARRTISGGFEARGLLRSGEHEMALARQRAAEGNQLGLLQGDTADQVAALEETLARTRADIARRRADEAALAAAGLYGSQAGY